MNASVSHGYGRTMLLMNEITDSDEGYRGHRTLSMVLKTRCICTNTVLKVAHFLLSESETLDSIKSVLVHLYCVAEDERKLKIII